MAHFIAKGLKTSEWTFFFCKLREALGEGIEPDVFMTDDDITYYKAWSLVMGTPKRKLLCTWHISKSWKRQMTVKKKKHVFNLLMAIKKTTCDMRNVERNRMHQTGTQKLLEIL